MKTRKRRQKSVAQIFDVDDVANKQFTITPTAWEKVKATAKRWDLTYSVVVEALCRAGLDEAIAYYKAKGFTSNRNKRSEELRHGESKRLKQVQLSEEADSVINKYVSVLQESRSEVIECAIRGGGLALAEVLIGELFKQGLK